MKLLAHNLGETFFEHVEDIAKLCLENLILDPYDDTVKHESRKLMRACIECCYKKPSH